MTFQGIPAESFEFYDGLVADNSKAYWTEHKGEYELHVRQPLLELVAELEPEFGPGHMYRPYRDVRFSRDEAPYKDHQGVFVESRNGLGWYVQISATGLMAAGGWYASTPQQVQRFREAVDADDEGRLARLLATALSIEALRLGGDRLKTRPREYPADHPRIEHLRHRSLFLSRTWEPAQWMETRQALEAVRQTWAATRPVMEWLAEAVGPGQPPTRGRR